MSDLDRRKFLGASAGLAAGMAAAQSAVAAEQSSTIDQPQDLPPGEVPPPPMITLGDTGVKMSRLGQGTGVHGGNRQSDQTRMGFQEIVSLFHHAYDRGLRFFDLADLYGTHVYFREALRTIPRDEVAILTKVWWRYDGPEDKTSDAERAQDTRATLERFRHELTTDYLDIVLLHCLMDGQWRGKMDPYMDVMNEEKEKGRIKAVGVSCHDFTALKAAAAEPWVDVILARINPKGVLMDASPDEVIAVLRQAKAAGKAIIGMKILGEGKLADQREECMKFAQGHDFMDAMTIGFEKPEQIDEVLRLMAKYPSQANG
ncbi:putative oxidoreductase [Posidoniimonas polymericola]|uniref:Putative oxidoreductase n=1 Tax=Posidoniimonas polymericola TaxID=2528002 RepID=A0A5C5YR65_9BACT|nr:aldo/keto reductase [Posidoniimonas polymericola]TWT77365.1 putative oxidoreductase [Posidoniimonas polymericola]